MLLKKCYVRGFGRLKDFSYEFTEGLNVICTENGWGKSTLASFLRAMLYGMPQASSRTKLEEAERRKYRPWDGAVMGGYLIFEVNGKEYKAERTFGKKEAEDTFRLIDLSTNLESADYSAELGKELFGLDKEAYSRSTYLPQNKITDGGMNDSIGKKLGKLAEGEDDGSNFDKAYERLDELRKKYVPDRQKEEKGYVAELTRKLSDTQMRLEACRRKEESAKPWREKEQSAAGSRRILEKRLANCREKLEETAAYEALAAKKRHYTELCGREEALRIKRDSMNGLFPAGVPELSELLRCRREAEEAATLFGELRSYEMTETENRQWEIWRERFRDGVPELTEIQDCIRSEAERRERLAVTEQECLAADACVKRACEAGKRCMWMAVAAVPMMFLCIAGGLYAVAIVRLLLFCLGTLCGVTGIGAVAAGVKNRRTERKQKERSAEALTSLEELRRRGKRGEELLKRYEANICEDVTEGLYRLTDRVREYRVLAEKGENRQRCAERREHLLRDSIVLLERNGMETEDIIGKLHILENRTEDFLRFSKELAEATEKRVQFEQDNPTEAFLGLKTPELSFAELQKEEQQLLSEIARYEEEEKDCRNRAEVFEEEAEEGTELEELSQQLGEELERKRREHFFLTETLRCLKNAKEQFSTRYMKGLKDGFDKYVNLLGAEGLSRSLFGKFGGAGVDINLNVRVSAYGEEKELGYFSTGLKDIIGLCMRFALVDALFTEEEPFLVLDDPFVNLDEEKAKRAVNFLKEAAGKYQILYLVCHESRT